MRTINREPLGIRKLDVQAERRAVERGRETRERIAGIAEHVWGITDPEVIRFAHVMFTDGWERGVREGAAATRDRVAESLANGRLVKTR